MRRTLARRAAIASSIVLAAAAPLSALGSSNHATKATASFANFAISNGKNGVATGGEPSMGYDPKRNAVLYGSSANPPLEYRLTFHDRAGRTSMQTANVTAPTQQETLDAITFTDRRTGRTFESQLLTACSAMAYSDDAGKSWTPSAGCGADTLLDHQSVGGGPFHAPITAGMNYPDAVYYCAQNGFNSSCAVSLDGGRTFGPGVYIVDTPTNKYGDLHGGGCSGLHGHIKVGPDGTAYVPLKGCGGTPTANNLTNSEYFGGAPAVSVSTDNGVTWTVHTVPGAHNQDESDNAIDTDKANRLYMTWEDGTNPSTTTFGTHSAAKAAFSNDEGKTWSKPVDLSSVVGVHNVQFPEIVAGDKGRAAVSFIGTNAVGDDQHNGFKGPDGKPAVWHVYVSMTYDGGKHWTTTDVTPTDAVQRGCVLMLGTSNKTATDNNLCSQRNMLDFNDMVMDGQGRVLVAWTDGCVGPCVHNRDIKSHDDVLMITRQSGGKGLIAKYDGKLGPVKSGTHAYKTSALFLLPLAATAAAGTRPRRRRT